MFWLLGLVVGCFLLRLRFGSLRLEVLVLPVQALGTGGVGEEHRSGAELVHVPPLGAVVEADVRGPDDMESPERTEIDRFGVEAVDVTAGGEAEGGVHGVVPPSPSCCWLALRLDRRQ